MCLVFFPCASFGILTICKIEGLMETRLVFVAFFMPYKNYQVDLIEKLKADRSAAFDHSVTCDSTPQQKNKMLDHN